MIAAVRATASDHALGVLEFGSALEYVARFASTPSGRRAVLAMRPASDGAVVRSRLDAVWDARRFLATRPEWTFPHVPDSRTAVKRLTIDGSELSAAEIAQLGVLLTAGRTVLRALAGNDAEIPALRALGERMLTNAELENAIVRSVDLEGAVLDGASRELRRLRSQLAGAHNRVVSHLESFLGRVDERHRVPEASVSIREGRYVVPVRREGKKAVGGYVHDESASGATVFVEPPSAIEMMNRVRALERAEVRETRRILRALTGRCRRHARGFADSMAALTELDRLVAVARTAVRWDARVPEVGEGLVSVRCGRHPLLMVSGVDPVPFDFDLEPGERVVVVTGPNAGGKTVFLKSVGLIAALTQAGVVAPVGPDTRLPVFDRIFAVVGDEQSIADSVSTFSAHLGNLREVLGGASPRSLVLIDELGAGTDPQEGEALARAVVETLADLGCVAVITSHLGGLKQLGQSGDRIVNASLRFDSRRLAPTYRFTKGRPGRSYGLAMARGLGFPARVLDRADAYRDRAEARLDELIEDLEEKEARSARLLAQLESERDRVTALKRELEGREADLRRLEREHALSARKQARQLLLDARREVEDVIARLSARIDSGRDPARAFRRARRSVEEAARALEETADSASREGGVGPDRAAPGGAGDAACRAGAVERGRSRDEAEALTPGSVVRVAGLEAHGTVVAIKGSRVQVSVGGVRMRVDGASVVPVAEGGREAAKSARPRDGGRWGGMWGGVGVDPTTELDLRGQRADEAALSLRRALDAASVVDLRELRVVHGKGTGVLRKQVSAVLAADERVEDYRTGKPSEGGYGVTVARLR